MKKTVMVTGASGFIGRQFCQMYADAYSLIPVSLRQTTPESLDFKGVDAVLHLAALVHQMHPVPQANYFDINTHLTLRLARAAKQAGVGHFVFYSTIKVYGTDGWFDDPQRVMSVHSLASPPMPTAQASGRQSKDYKSYRTKPLLWLLLDPP